MEVGARRGREGRHGGALKADLEGEQGVVDEEDAEVARILFLSHRGQTAFLPAHQQAAVADRTGEFAGEHIDGAPPPQAPLEVAVDHGVVGRRLFGRLTETRHVMSQ